VSVALAIQYVTCICHLSNWPT